MTSAWPLEKVGPAQFDWLIHFCGRSPGAMTSRAVAPEIAGMKPSQRLDNILWEQQLRGFPPFGADVDRPMICLSESPPDHLRWLVTDRQWPPWGLFFERQYVYEQDGGPVWSVRSAQYDCLTPEQRAWAVRLDTTPGRRSDWLFEREWRMPLRPGTTGLPLTRLLGILVGDRNWQPSVREVYTGYYRSAATGELAHPHDPYAQPDTHPALPALWHSALFRVYWDPDSNGFISLDASP